MGNGWSAETLATFMAAVVGAVVAATSVIATIVVARDGRRQASLERRRDRWWEQWSWVADRAFSEHPVEEQAAVVMLGALSEVRWSDEADFQIAIAIQARRMRGHRDDLGPDA